MQDLEQKENNAFADKIADKVTINLAIRLLNRYFAKTGGELLTALEKTALEAIHPDKAWDIASLIAVNHCDRAIINERGA